MKSKSHPGPAFCGRRTFLAAVATHALGLGAFLDSLQAAPPDFTVKSATDSNSFKLSSARGRVVALHFLLKTECPYCLRHTRAYAGLAASMPEVVHVFLKPDSEAEIRAWKEKGSADPGFKGLTIYRDPEGNLADQFGIPGGYKFHGEVVHFPALVVLDRNGREIFRHIGKDNSDRFTVDQFRVKLPEWIGSK